MNKGLKEVERDLVVEGKNFVYIKERLRGGKVFERADKSEYLRAGSEAEIAEEVNLTKILQLSRQGKR